MNSNPKLSYAVTGSAAWNSSSLVNAPQLHGNRYGQYAEMAVGSPDRSPIFVVGLPRAGSTLIEQILASHSRVEGTTELADIPRLVQRLQGREQNDLTPRYPEVLAEWTPQQVQQFGEKYPADTRAYREKCALR